MDEVSETWECSRDESSEGDPRIWRLFPVRVCIELRSEPIAANEEI